MTLRDRIAALRGRAGLSAQEAAVAAGWSTASSWHHYEREGGFKKDSIPLDTARRMARALVGRGSPPITETEVFALADVASVASVRTIPLTGMVEIIGVVEAGAWRESFELSQEDRAVLPMPSGLGYDAAWLFGAEVRGHSMDLVYPEGSRVICVRAEFVTPRDGDDVVVRRARAGLYETTLKRFTIDKKGRVALLPQSSHPAHQEPLYLGEEGVDEAEIIGIVVAEFRIRPRGDRNGRRR